MDPSSADGNERALMSELRGWVRRSLEAVDRWYYRRHKLRTVGPVLLLGRGLYRGPSLHFEDGTSLLANQPIGRLHFNNARIAALGEGSMHQTGLRFARLMRLSLLHLAECAHSDPEFHDVWVFEGVTWIPEHGKVLGFVSRPLSQGFRRQLLTAHFRLLLWAFAPAAKVREMALAEPRVYWLTRSALQRNLDKLARNEQQAE